MMHPLINTTTAFDVVILAGGNMPQHSIPKHILQQAPCIVCCDSAIDMLHTSLHHKVKAIVGDGDSMSETTKHTFQAILHIENEQDDNDLTKATRYCIAQHYQRIAYLGATGKREDHTLGNISLLIHYLQNYLIQPIMITDYGSFVPCYGNNVFQSFARQQVSIFNFTCNQLDSNGLRWQSYAYKTWWQGTLNEALYTQFSLQADGFYLVYRTHEPK